MKFVKSLHMGKGTYTVLYYVVLAQFLFFQTGCGNDNPSQANKEKAAISQESEHTLKLAVMPTLDCLPVYIAKEHGWFEKNKISVQLMPFYAAMDCDTALIKGHADGGITELVRAERIRRKGVSLAFWAATNTYWQLIANKNARVKEVKQLGDKMLAMTRHSATEFLANIAVSEANPVNPVFRVQINDVIVRLKMLLNNEMDAMMLTEPQATTARINHHTIIMDSRDKDLRLGVWVWNNGALNDHNKVRHAQIFQRIYNEACDSINRYGLQHYGGIIAKYCGADKKTIIALPKLSFPHATPPRQKDIDKAKTAVDYVY